MSLGGLVKDKDLWHKYVAICKRNGVDVGKDITAFIAETVRNHETGNDQMKIEQWVDNSNMKAVPAFNSKRETWTNYISKINPKELDEFKLQLEKISKSIPLTIEKPKESNDVLKIYDGFIPRDEWDKGKQAYIRKLEESNAD